MFDLSSLGKWLLIFGLISAAVGGLVWLAGKLNLPVGRLPGDFRFQVGNVSCFIPLATSILLSVLLTLALNLIMRWLGK